jgi:hypothetical protein
MGKLAMKIFIWKDIDGLERSYHDNGAVAVIAKSYDDAVSAIKAATNGEADIDGKQPDEVFDLAGDPRPQVFIFPNSGCC